MGALAWILVPAVLFAAVVWTVLTVRGGGVSEGRPWWGRPASWMAVWAGLLVLGVVVAPRVFGFALLFLPLVWFRRPRVRR
jgi:hypothetical protein